MGSTSLGTWVGLSDTQNTIDALEVVRGNAGGTSLEMISAAVLAGTLLHSNLSGLAPGDGGHTDLFLNTGRAGGQTANAGLAAGDTFTQRGSAGSPDRGIVDIESPITLSYDRISNTTPAQSFILRAAEAVTHSALFVGGVLQVAHNDLVLTGLYIPATFSDTSLVRTGTPPAFSAVTFINHLSAVENSGAVTAITPVLAYNMGVVHRRTTSGTSTVTIVTGFSFTPQVATSVSGAVMNKTSQIGLRCGPTHNGPAGSTTGHGAITAVQCDDVAVALFGNAGSTKTLTSYVGLDFANMSSVAASGVKAAVRSAQNAGANNYNLLFTGTAVSNFGGTDIFDVGIVQHLQDGIGGSDSFGAAGGDFLLYWDGSQTVFNPIIGDNFNLAYATNIHTLSSASVSEDSAINFDYPKAAWGEAGSPGNNKFRFVGNAETISIGGDFTGMLWTSAANDTIDAAIGTYATATWNASTPALGTGSLTTNAVMNIGGNPGTAATNRAGLRIISSPTGGAGINAALWVTAGVSRFDGRVDINNGIALGGGATALLGTIGGSGPAAATQIIWVECDVNGVATWLPGFR